MYSVRADIGIAFFRRGQPAVSTASCTDALHVRIVLCRCAVSKPYPNRNKTGEVSVIWDEAFYISHQSHCEHRAPEWRQTGCAAQVLLLVGWPSWVLPLLQNRHSIHKSNSFCKKLLDEIYPFQVVEKHQSAVKAECIVTNQYN